MKNQQRYAVTIGAVLLYYLLSYIPLCHYSEAYTFPKGHSTIDLFALGLSPIFSGFMLVEIISFLIYPFNRWRTQGMIGRKKINFAQLVLMIIVAGFQGWSTCSLYSTFDSSNPLVIFGITGSAAQIILCVCLVDGVLILYLLASSVTRFGMVNGFIVFLFVCPLVRKTFALIDGIQTDLRLNKLDASYPDLTAGLHFSTFDEKMNFIYFLFAIVGVGFILIQKRKKILDFIYQNLLRRPVVTYQDQENSYQVKTSPIPQTITGGLGFIPFSIIMFGNGISSMDPTWKQMSMSGAAMIDLILFSFLFWFLLTNRYWIDHHLEDRATWIFDRAKLKPYFVFWLVVTAINAFLSYSFIFSHFPKTLTKLGEIFLEPIFILSTLILGIEIVEKWKFEQKAGQNVCLAEMDNVEMVQLWVAQLEEANISFHVEGLRYRQLTQFFAPYIKMRLFVDERQAMEAANIIRLEEVKQL